MRMLRCVGRWRYLMLVAGLFPPVVMAADAEELEARFEAGMQALEENRLQSARAAFQAILEADSSLHRARLELALTYHRLLNYQEAEALAREVLEDPATPPQVRLSITAFLAQVEADRERLSRRHAWRASLAFGGMHDSNVNVGPGTTLLADTVRLRPDATARVDNGVVVQSALSHTYNSGKRYEIGQQAASLLWQSQLSHYYREYDDEDDFNLNVTTFSTGPALVALGAWRAGANLTLDYIRLGGEDLALFTTLQPHVTWQFDHSELTLDGSHALRRYDKDVDSGREGGYSTAGGSVARHFLDRKLTLQGSGHYLNFEADDDQWGFEGSELSLALTYRGWSRGQIYVRAAQRNLDFDGVFPLFGDARDDKRDERERRLTVGFTHTFAGGLLNQWQMRGEIERLINRSNVKLFEYDRTQISLMFKRDFELGS